MRPLQCVEKSLAPSDEGAVCDSLNAALWAVARLHGACGRTGIVPFFEYLPFERNKVCVLF